MTLSIRRAAWLTCCLYLAACGGGGGGGSLTSSGSSSSGSSSSGSSSGSSSSSSSSSSGGTSSSGSSSSGSSSSGGSSSGSSSSGGVSSSSSSGGSSATNTLAVIVDSGPAALANANVSDANVLFATVTICTPGSTTACQTVDHVQLDTGSTGLGIMSEVLTGAAVPTPISVSGGPLRECLPYADGYVWGSMAYVDVYIGSRMIPSLPVNIMGDPAAGTAPASCSTGYTSSQNESSVIEFGANGVLGVGYFLQDCGTACAPPGPAPSQAYYACPTMGCVPTTALLTQQMTNPVGALSADNNGVVIVLPAVAAAGQASVSGTLYFGIGTESNNALSVPLLTVEDSGSAAGTFTTQFNGSTLTGSVIDAGSNGYFFNDSAIATCTGDNSSYFCPVTGSGAATTVALSGTLVGVNNVSSPQAFEIGNAATLFDTSAELAAFPTLGGPNGALNGIIPGFDWGLPFFFNRSVYVLFETFEAGGVAGPAVGFTTPTS